MAAKRKTGEPQKTRQAFHIDRLPPHVRETIELLKNRHGKTWAQIEALSAEPFPKKVSAVPLGGFMQWEELDPEVLALFPNKRIPSSNLQRWYDVRVQQVKADTLHRSKAARELAHAFSKAAVDDGDEAVLNACRDTIMGVLAEDGTAAGRHGAAKQLLVLAQVQQKARALQLLERRVSVDEKTLQIKLDEIKHKAEELLKEMEKKGHGEGAMSDAQVMARVREFYNLAN